MDAEDTALNPFYHPQRHHQQPPQPPHHHQQQPPSSSPSCIAPSLSNGIFSGNERGAPVVYPHSVPSAVSSPLETVRRKRGRPRKYGTPEQAAAAKRLSASSPSPSLPLSPARKKNQALCVGPSGSSSSSPRKSQLNSLGNVGQSFTPHVISVAAGEDVGQKIMQFMQQSKCEICVLSASGSISNASLRQPATSGGNITYEGRFDILSLCGSFVHNEIGGRTGGLSVCLSTNDGQIIGGGIGGPLTAAGSVLVIVGTFTKDPEKETTVGTKSDASATKLPLPIGVGPSASSIGFLFAGDNSSGRNAVRGSDDQQSMGGNPFIIQPPPMQLTPPRSTNWRTSGTDSRTGIGFDFSGRMGLGSEQSPENGDYDEFQD